MALAVKKKLSSTSKTKPANDTVKKTRRIEENKTVLTLSETLQSDDSQLYVVNTSSQVTDKGETTKLLLDLALANGTSFTIDIPASWLPVDLTASANREDILNSTNFRRALADGYLQIITTEEANRILSSDREGVRDERRRLKNLGKDDEDGGSEESATNDEANVSGAVVALANRALGPRDKLAAVRSLENSLTEADIRYLISKATKADIKMLAFLDTLREKRKNR